MSDEPEPLDESKAWGPRDRTCCPGWTVSGPWAYRAAYNEGCPIYATDVREERGARYFQHWCCEPPAEGVPYRVVRERWTNNMVRYIDEIELA